jgi:ABC-2 type transport system permease protein
MTGLLHAELLKLRTTRTFAALAGAALALSLIVIILTATLDNGLTEGDLRLLFGGDFTGLFILLLGAIGITGEWRHRTIAGSVLAAPERVRLLGAKTLAYAAAGVALSLVVTTAIMLVGTLILSSRGEATLGVVELADVMWRNLAVAALLGALGVGVGALVRNQTAAVIGLLVVLFALEPALAILLPEAGRFGPLSGAPSGIIGGADLPQDELLAPGLAVAVSIAWAAAAFAAAAASLRGRDLV